MHSPPKAASLLLSSVCLFGAVEAWADTITIVAIGASNTVGWGVGAAKAYPAQLEDMLRSRGYDARVRNVGRNFDTTAGMLRRLNTAVPNGTTLVILQPGGNDLRFFGTRERRTANIQGIAEQLEARKVKVIIFDPPIPSNYYQWDKIHITADGHKMFAATLLPEVIATIRSLARVKQLKSAK